MGYYEIYTDNFNIRFWLTVFFIFNVIYLIKVGLQVYFIEDDPSIIEKYLIAKSEYAPDLDKVLSEAAGSNKEHSK